jgi:alpha-D-xyloside xylohydrolase
MKEAHEMGTPIMRTLFYEFPDDPKSWEVRDEYLFGDRYLVAPVLSAGVTARDVYLPSGARWKNQTDGSVYEGGCTVSAPAPLHIIPVFERIN